MQRETVEDSEEEDEDAAAAELSCGGAEVCSRRRRNVGIGRIELQLVPGIKKAGILRACTVS